MSRHLNNQRQAHLLFVRENTLMAQPVDPTSLRFSGEELPVAEPVTFGGNTAHAMFSASAGGLLVYLTEQATGVGQLAWFDRQGGRLGAVGKSGRIENFALSPDSSRVAIARYSGESFAADDISLLEISRNVETRFTFDAATAHLSPVWSPDGNWIVFYSLRPGAGALYRKRTNGAEQEEKIWEDGMQPIEPPLHWSKDGRFLALRQNNSAIRVMSDPGAATGTVRRKPSTLLDANSRARAGQFSPDSKWFLYWADESGRPEIYVRPFEDGTLGSGKWQVSSAGGIEPR